MSVIKDKLLSRIVKAENGCWVWNAYINMRGTPYFAPSKNKRVSAVRASFEEFNGPIFDDKIIVTQSCGNRICINPEHLILEVGKEFIHRKQNTKTHCIKGHDLSQAYINARGKRVCKLCASERYQKKKNENN